MKRKEVYQQFFAALPETPVQFWTIEECRRVKIKLKPIFKHYGGFRNEMFAAIERRMKELMHG
jgi:hypothetical protein